MADIKKIWIEEGCISCNLCEDTCPTIFEVPIGGYSTVKPGAVELANSDSATGLTAQQAADSCPVEVIQIERD